MTTASWSTVVDQTSDAAFRTWGSELNTKFAAVGMVQTADTGQINWTTVTRAGTNTAAGYEIWRLSGSALFFKIEYGSGSSNAVPSFWLTVGTGSNGTGTLTGQLSTRTQHGNTGTGISSTVTNYQSYLCATANYFGLSWKIGSVGTVGQARTFMLVAQTVDITGAATAVGYFTLLSITSNTPQMQCVATTAAVTGPVLSSSNFFLIPGNISAGPPSSQDGLGNNQAFLMWFSILGTTPVSPLQHAAMALLSDLTLGNTATITLVGSSGHTYISSSKAFFSDPPSVITAANMTILLLWE